MHTRACRFKNDDTAVKRTRVSISASSVFVYANCNLSYDNYKSYVYAHFYDV